VDEGNFWYNIDSMNGQVGSTLRTFFDFADANVDMEDRGYMIKLNLVSQGDPTIMTAFIKGVALPDPFEVPVASSTIDIFDVTVNGFKFTLLKANRFSTSCKYVIDDLTVGSVIEGDETFNFDEVTVSVKSVLPLHQFTVRYSYNTKLGHTPPSAPAQPFFTTPATEPQQLQLTGHTHQAILVSWTQPAIVAEQLLPLLQYRVQLRQGTMPCNGPTNNALRAGDTLLKEQRTDGLEAAFERLPAAANFSVSVSAFVADYPLARTMHRESGKKCR
jgi:hypothetical protein